MRKPSRKREREREKPGEGRVAGNGSSALGGCWQPGIAPYLAELQGGDDQEDDASKAKAGPIAVGQTGVGLSLQELQQHGPPGTITLQPAPPVPPSSQSAAGQS